MPGQGQEYQKEGGGGGYSYDNLMIGLVHKGKCVYASDFASNYITVYKGEWGKSISTGDFEILTEGNDVKWVNTNGKIPQRALALGYRSSFDTQKYGVVKSTDTHLRSIYACRVITRDAKSTVGWTMNGTDCTFLYKGKVTTGWGGYFYHFKNDYTAQYPDKNNVQILVRDAGKVVRLDLAEKK